MCNGIGHIAVLDIGRTNKKLLIYDQELNMTDGVYAEINELKMGRENHEALEVTIEFFLTSLAKMARRYTIKAISISTYGATFVCVNEEGQVALPPLSASTDPGESFHSDFDASIGNPRQIHRQTATPRMPFLSVMARGIFYVKKHYPQAFARTKAILGLPQYYGFLLTGKIGIDRTYIGTHTGLWNFQRSCWSDVYDRLEIKGLIPEPISNPYDVLGHISPEIAKQTGLPDSVIVTMGIHDSTASMVPFLIGKEDDFVLVSTGSMCAVMHPAFEPVLSEAELGEMIYYNLDAFGGIFKTSLFVAGLEFDLYMELLEARHGRSGHPDFNPALISDILNRREEFILPCVVPYCMYMDSPARIIEGNRVFTFEQVFSGDAPGFFQDYERAYAVLVLSMVLHTRKAIIRAGVSPGKMIFIEGGFSNNTLYIKMIASLFPDSPVMVTNLKEATSLGAAILGLIALEKLPLHQLAERLPLAMKQIPATRFEDLNAYANAFENHLDKRNL